MSGHDLAMALRGAYLSMHRRTDAVLAQAGVTADQFVVLAALSENSARTQRDLVARTSSDPNSLRAMLVLLERRGLIVRFPHPTDGRARGVALTRKGRSTFRRVWRLSESVRQQLLTAMTPDELKACVHHLQLLTAALEQQAAAVPATHRLAVSSGRS